MEQIPIVFILSWNHTCSHTMRLPCIAARRDAGWDDPSLRGHPAHPTAAPRGPPPVCAHRHEAATWVWAEERGALRHLHDTYQLRRESFTVAEWALPAAWHFTDAAHTRPEGSLSREKKINMKILFFNACCEFLLQSGASSCWLKK